MITNFRKYSVNPIIFGSRKAQSLRTLKGAATLKIQCDTAFTKHLQIFSKPAYCFS